MCKYAEITQNINLCRNDNYWANVSIGLKNILNLVYFVVKLLQLNTKIMLKRCLGLKQLIFHITLLTKMYRTNIIKSQKREKKITKKCTKKNVKNPSNV